MTECSITRRAALAFAALAVWPLPVARRPNGTCRPPIRPSNYHSENLVWFAEEVKKATGGKLEITVHAGASLFKAPEIKRAVATGQAQIGEVLISIHENEDPVFGIDTIPFLASSFAEARSCGEAAKAHDRQEARQPGHDGCSTRAVGPQGIYAKKEINAVDDMKGLKMRAYNVGTTRIAELAGAQP